MTTTTKNIYIIPDGMPDRQAFQTRWDTARGKAKDGGSYTPHRLDGRPFGFTVTRHDARETWLAEHDAIGKDALITATNASAILGLSRYETPVALWKLKTGRAKPKDLSDNPYVQRGIEHEPLIRENFISYYKDEFDLAYLPHDIIHRKDAPYIGATLDGMLFYKGLKPLPCCGGHIAPQSYGVLEIKTGSYATRRELEEWRDGELRADYLCQCCHQLLVTGFDFVILLARAFRLDRIWGEGRDNSSLPQKVQRAYFIDARDPQISSNVQLILSKAIDFHDTNILGDRCPDVVLEI